MPEATAAARQPISPAASAAASLGWARQQSKSTPPIIAPNATSIETGDRPQLRARAGSDSRQIAMDNASKAAALLAAAAGAADKRNAAASATAAQISWGNSAANQAFKSSHPLKTRDKTRLNGRSLAAARDAMAPRPRSVSTPMPPRASNNSDCPSSSTAAAASALSAATLAHHHHRPSTATSDAGASPVVVMARNMYTAAPPVSIEVDEQRAAETRHASAVAMARTIYLQHQNQQQQQQQQQRAAGTAVTHSETVFNDNETVISDSTDGGILAHPVSLQEAAYRLAQERLKKLQDEIERNKEQQVQRLHTEGPGSSSGRFTGLSTMFRRRSVSLDHSVAAAAAHGGPDADADKRSQERGAIMDMARRNVRERLRGIDDRIAESSKAATASLSNTRNDWKAKAQALAQARFDSSQNSQARLDVGGGMFVSQSEVDAIAARRVQPLLDELDERAKAERQRVEMARAEQEAKKLEQTRLRAQERDAIRRARGELPQSSPPSSPLSSSPPPPPHSSSTPPPMSSSPPPRLSSPPSSPPSPSRPLAFYASIVKKLTGHAAEARKRRELKRGQENQDPHGQSQTQNPEQGQSQTRGLTQSQVQSQTQSQTQSQDISKGPENNTHDQNRHEPVPPPPPPPRTPRRLERLVKRPTTMLDTNVGRARDGTKSADDDAISPSAKVKMWLRNRLQIKRDDDAGDGDAREGRGFMGFIGGKALVDSLAAQDSGVQVAGVGSSTLGDPLIPGGVLGSSTLGVGRSATPGTYESVFEGPAEPFAPRPLQRAFSAPLLECASYGTDLGTAAKMTPLDFNPLGMNPIDTHPDTATCTTPAVATTNINNSINTPTTAAPTIAPTTTPMTLTAPANWTTGQIPTTSPAHLIEDPMMRGALPSSNRLPIALNTSVPSIASLPSASVVGSASPGRDSRFKEIFG